MKDWLGLLTPFGLAFGFLWRVWLKQRYEEGRQLFVKITKIAEEFRPNGGSTLRDAINRIEEKVTANEQKTLAIIKTLPLGTWIADSKGKWTDPNKSLCRITGRTESELKGDNWSNWIHPSQREEVFEEWQRCIENDINFDQEFNLILPDGTNQKVHANAYQLKDAKGDLKGMLGTMSKVNN